MTKRLQITGRVNGSLRARIAAVLASVEVVLDGGDNLNETSTFLLADAVIRELEPELNRHNSGCVCDDCWPGEEREWENDDASS